MPFIIFRIVEINDMQSDIVMCKRIFLQVEAAVSYTEENIEVNILFDIFSPISPYFISCHKFTKWSLIANGMDVGVCSASQRDGG